MATIIEEFVSTWVIDADQDSVDEALASVKSIGIGLFWLAGAGAAASVALFHSINSIAKSTDELGKSARDFGQTTEAFENLKTASELAGTSINEVTKGIARASKAAVDAEQGSKTYAKSFKSLNINVSDFIKLTPSEKLASISKGLESIEDPARRAVLRMDLLGRSGQKMGSLLDGGEKAFLDLMATHEKYGAATSPFDLQNAEQYNDGLLKVRLFTGGIVKTFVQRLLPSVNKITEAFLRWIKANKDSVFKKIRKVADSIATGFELLHKAIEVVADFTNDVIEKFGGLDSVLRIAGVTIGWLTASLLYFVAVRFGGHILSIARAFSVLRVKALLANAAVIALPLLIGAIIAIVGLLIEDFYRFGQGQDSLIGRLVEKYTWFAQIFGFLSSVASDVGKAFGEMGDWLVSTFTSIFNFLNDATDGFLDKTVGALKVLMKKIAEYVLPVLEVGAKLIGWDQGTINDLKAIGNGTFDFGIAPPSPRQKKQQALIVNNSTNFSVVTQPGQSNQEIAKIVDDKIKTRDKNNGAAIRHAVSTGVKR